MNRWVTLGVLIATGVALALRCPRLSERPMHNDEGVNALKFAALQEGRGYKYDPNEFHGPSLPYATAAIGWLTRAPGFADYSEARLRAVTVVFGVATLLLLPLFYDALGAAGVGWAALLTAVSTAMVFYSRYYIHEILLVFFSVLTLAAAWRYWRSRRLGWALLTGVALGLMQATKETFILSVAAAVAALALNHLWNRRFDASGAPVRAPGLNRRHLLLGFLCWLIIVVVFFSSFFTNFHGITDAFATYVPWIRRAGSGSAQVQPWYFYLRRALFFHAHHGPIWSEGLVLVLAIAGIAAAFIRKRLGSASASFLRFLAFYAVILTGIYSVLPYKTPWCILNFWQILLLLAGAGAAVLTRLARSQWARAAIRLAVVIGASQLAAQAWQAATTWSDDPRNPWVYAQTSWDVLGMVEKIQALDRISPQPMVVQVIAEDGDYWPLPWYLRKLKTGWQASPGDELFAPVLVVSPAFSAQIEKHPGYVMTGFYALRPRVFLMLYVRAELWDRYLASVSK